jgi:hypothetical protein
MQPGGLWHDHVLSIIAARDGTELDPEVKARQDNEDRLVR